VAGACECGNEVSGPIKFGKFLTSLGPARFAERTLLHDVSSLSHFCRFYDEWLVNAPPGLYVVDVTI
jgi:hypothetical protein